MLIEHNILEITLDLAFNADHVLQHRWESLN
jgi:hypothetical protein